MPLKRTLAARRSPACPSSRSSGIRISRLQSSNATRHRLRVGELPRLFHGHSPERQAEILAARPRRTGLPSWDALLTAVSEHVAVLHGHPVPEWANETERFLDPPQTATDEPGCDYEARTYAPPAFQPYGALIDPTDLDPRGSERREWVPGTWNWIVPQRPCPWKPDWQPPTAGEIRVAETALAAVYEQASAVGSGLNP